MKVSLFRAISLAALLAATGCGKGPRPDGTTTVSGVITLPGGKPLPGGRIDFRSTAEPTKLGSGIIKGDGTYEAAGVPVGECQIAIENSQLRRTGHVAGADAMPGNHDLGQKYVPISAKYANPQTSGLTTTIPPKDYVYSVEVK